MERIGYSKRVKFYPEELEGEYIGKLKGMLVYVEGEAGDELINAKLYLNKPTGVRVVRYQPIAELNLSSGSLGYTKNAYHADLSQIDYRFQGHGLMPLLYRFLLRRMGIAIQAGVSQSPGGRSIWAKLSKMPGVLVFATLTTRKTKNIFPIELDKEDEELHHDELEIYDGDQEVYAYATAVRERGKKRVK